MFAYIHMDFRRNPAHTPEGMLLEESQPDRPGMSPDISTRRYSAREFEFQDSKQGSSRHFRQEPESEVQDKPVAASPDKFHLEDVAIRPDSYSSGMWPEA